MVIQGENGLKEGTSEDEALYAIDIADDGSVILGGETEGVWRGTNDGEKDFVAVKLSANGTEEWRWQEGAAGDDIVNDITIGEDGSAFVSGYSDGDWEGISAGFEEFAVAKLSSNGDILWRWQAGTSLADFLSSAAVRSDGSIFVVGITYGDWDGENVGSADFAGAMLDADGNQLWRWMNGTTSSDYAGDVVITEDDSIIICGHTYGSFGGPNDGDRDMVVIKLSSDGNLLWAWQGGTDAEDDLWECKVGSDGSIYLAGNTEGDWFGSNAGESDFAAAKLDAEGNEIWKWQEGTPAEEKLFAAAITEDGSLFLAGYTYGTWSSQAAGYTDFAIVKLHPTSGTVLWRWQEGTSDYDWITEAASNGNRVVFGANVNGDWERVSAGYTDFAAIMLESTGLENSSYPTTSPTHSPLEMPTPMPTPIPTPIPTSIPVPSQASTPQPLSLPVETPIPTPLSTSPSADQSAGTVYPVAVSPMPTGTETLGPSVSGNTRPSSASPSSPSPSSPSLSNANIAIISGVSGAVVGVVITGLVIFLWGKRHARRSASQPQSLPRSRNTPPAPSVAPRPPPPDYHTAYAQRSA